MALPKVEVPLYRKVRKKAFTVLFNGAIREVASFLDFFSFDFGLIPTPQSSSQDEGLN